MKITVSGFQTKYTQLGDSVRGGRFWPKGGTEVTLDDGAPDVDEETIGQTTFALLKADPRLKIVVSDTELAVEDVTPGITALLDELEDIQLAQPNGSGDAQMLSAIVTRRNAALVDVIALIAAAAA